MVKSKRSKRIVPSSEGSSSGGTGDIDRISNLPQPLISQILSFLPTRRAVATSILSTRWKFLWTSISNLDFNSYELAGYFLREEAERKAYRNKFTQFVNRVLLLLNPPSVHNFHLKCSQQHIHSSYLNSWISAGFGRTVRELVIALTLKEPMELPLTHFHFNIAVLKLKGDIHVNIPAATSLCFPGLQTLHLNRIAFAIAGDSSVSFPNLRNMHLNCVDYANEDSVHKLFSSCPVLVDLIIKREDWDNVLRLIIHIPSLTSLRLSFIFPSSHNFPCKLQLDTPALQYLDLRDDLPFEYLPAENLSSLLQANVNLNFHHGDNDNVERCVSICKFIESLSKVKSLSVSGKTLKAIRTASANISVCFHNLTRLELEADDHLNLSVVNNFLESMDNLEHLFIKCWSRKHSHRSWWTEPLNVPKCLLSRVTTISFDSKVLNCCDQLELLRYFLKNAEALQLLTISTGPYSNKNKLELLQKISMFPRGSRTCQVSFT